MADNNEIWPPAPTLTPPQSTKEIGNSNYNYIWLAEDLLCFAVAIFGGMISFGLLDFPILLIAVLVLLLAKSRRVKCAAISVAWGAGPVVLLFCGAIVINCLTIPWH